MIKSIILACTLLLSLDVLAAEMPYPQTPEPPMRKKAAKESPANAAGAEEEGEEKPTD